MILSGTQQLISYQMIINGVHGNSVYGTVVNLVCGYAALFGEKSEKEMRPKKKIDYFHYKPGII